MFGSKYFYTRYLKRPASCQHDYSLTSLIFHGKTINGTYNCVEKFSCELRRSSSLVCVINLKHGVSTFTILPLRNFGKYDEGNEKPFITCGLQRNIEPWFRETSEERSRIPFSARLLLAVSLFGFFGFANDGRENLDEKNNDKRALLKARKSFAVEVKKEERRGVQYKNPPVSEDIPKNVPYLIVGGGTAAYSAFQTILQKDPSAKVLVISNEPYYPYKRPPLSKEMFFQEKPAGKPHFFTLLNGKEKSLFYKAADSYVPCSHLMRKDVGAVAVARGWSVKKIDVGQRKAILNDGYEIEFDKCLIATGCSPKTVPFLTSESPYIKERVSFFTDIFDYQEIEKVLRKGKKSIVIIGGGILACELACSLLYRGRRNGADITQIFSEKGNLQKVLPEYLSVWVSNKLEKDGVKLYPNTTVKSVSAENGLTLHLNTGEEIYADHVIVAVGGVPNTQFAKESKLEVDSETGGFMVNAELMARSNIWVAGDCCSFFDSKMGRIRLERHDHAVISGRIAAENMTGAGKPYEHHSIFWSDLGPNFGYEAVGIIDSKLPTVAVFSGGDNVASQTVVQVNDKKSREANLTKKSDDLNKGIIFYLQNDIVVGVLLWNIYGQLAIARKIVEDGRRADELDQVAKLFSFSESKPFPHMDGQMYTL